MSRDFLTRPPRDWINEVDARQAVPNANRIPSFPDWRRWGALEQREVEWTAAAENVSFDIPQIVDARFDHPLAWMLGFHMTQAAKAGSTSEDFVQFFAKVTYGLGSGQFRQEQFVGGFPNPAAPQFLVVPFGPIPAETVIIGCRIDAQPNGAGSFPRKNVFTFGAFCAPQVW